MTYFNLHNFRISTTSYNWRNATKRVRRKRAGKITIYSSATHTRTLENTLKVHKLVNETYKSFKTVRGLQKLPKYLTERLN